MTEKAKRPRVLGGITVKVATGCGNMYIQMNWRDGQLFEVFATLGKTGGCATSESEAVTRSVTLGLRSGVPVDEYIKQLRGIRCPNPMPFPKEYAVSSCSDAIAQTLSKYGKLGIENVIRLIRGEQVEVSEEEQAKAAMEEMASERPTIS